MTEQEAISQMYNLRYGGCYSGLFEENAKATTTILVEFLRSQGFDDLAFEVERETGVLLS